nr:ribonuclease H-like domain-containing protein [Tanacetum cinerariifolium]
KKYAVEILEKVHMVNCNPSRTPVDTESKLGVDGDPVVPDPTLYRSLAGSLQYLTFTKPDISYAVQQGTMHYGLQLLSSSTTNLVAYSDADWAGCPTIRRSIQAGRPPPLAAGKLFRRDFSGEPKDTPSHPIYPTHHVTLSHSPPPPPMLSPPPSPLLPSPPSAASSNTTTCNTTETTPTINITTPLPSPPYYHHSNTTAATAHRTPPAAASCLRRNTTTFISFFLVLFEFNKKGCSVGLLQKGCLLEVAAARGGFVWTAAAARGVAAVRQQGAAVQQP